MTLTSTGPSGFHIRPIVTVLAVVAFVAGVYAISQQIVTDSQPGASESSEAVAETAEPYAGPSGLSEAYANGKLDAGLNPASSEPHAGSTPAPEIVVIEGQGSLYNALIEGKYDVDFLSGASGAHYVLAPEAASSTSGSSEALAAGKFDAGLVPEPSQTSAGSEPASEIVVIEGQGSLYNALIEGKYAVDFLSGASGVQYVLDSDAEAGVSSQLVEGFGDGTFAERSAAASAAGSTPTVSGGHQE